MDRSLLKLNVSETTLRRNSSTNCALRQLIKSMLAYEMWHLNLMTTEKRGCMLSVAVRLGPYLANTPSKLWPTIERIDESLGLWLAQLETSAHARLLREKSRKHLLSGVWLVNGMVSRSRAKLSVLQGRSTT